MITILHHNGSDHLTSPEVTKGQTHARVNPGVMVHADQATVLTSSSIPPPKFTHPPSPTPSLPQKLTTNTQDTTPSNSQPKQASASPVSPVSPGPPHSPSTTNRTPPTSVSPPPPTLPPDPSRTYPVSITPTPPPPLLPPGPLEHQLLLFQKTRSLLFRPHLL